MRHARAILVSALFASLAVLGCHSQRQELVGRAPGERKVEAPASAPVREIAGGPLQETVTGPAKETPLGSPEREARATRELPLDATRRIGEPMQARNLTVWAVFADSYPEIGEFLTLAEAEERKVATVRELGSGGPGASDGSASVQAVMVENKGDLPIFVCAGTVIKGGKQDRQIAQDLVIAPREKVRIPVFCVEAARWNSRREGEDTGGAFKVLNVLAAKEVRLNAQYAQDQGRVWEWVESYHRASGRAPATRTFVAAIEAPDEQAAFERAALESIVLRHFERLRESGRSPVGFAYSIDGEPVTVRTFAHPRLFEKYLPAFAKTMSLEAELAQRAARKSGRKIYGELASLEKVVDFVRQASRGEAKAQRTTAATRNLIRLNEVGGRAQCEVLLPAGEGAGIPAEARSFILTEDWTSKR